MKWQAPITPAKAGIQCRRTIADRTPAFAGVTPSRIIVSHQYQRCFDRSAHMVAKMETVVHPYFSQKSAETTEMS